MPIQIVRNDITKMSCDAIVNAANHTLLGGGGVDGAIHKAAGKDLLKECRTLGGCKTGEAKITSGYNLPCKYVIHTVGPIWQDGNHNEEKLLEECYRNSLRLAKENRCESVAFPLISTGAYHFPKEQALQIAISEISRFLFENEMLVYIVVYDKGCFQVSKKLISDITEYIDECYVDEHYQCRSTMAPSYPLSYEEKSAVLPFESLSEALNTLDESFSQMLLRKIDEKKLTDSQCYKKANIDRKLFSKIKNNPQYKPRKATVVAFVIALELPLEEAREMLSKAGYSLTHSNKFDIIIEYFIKKGEYDIFTINETLFEFDQVLLG